MKCNLTVTYRTQTFATPISSCPELVLVPRDARWSFFTKPHHCVFFLNCGHNSETHDKHLKVQLHNTTFSIHWSGRTAYTPRAGRICARLVCACVYLCALTRSVTELFNLCAQIWCSDQGWQTDVLHINAIRCHMLKYIHCRGTETLHRIRADTETMAFQILQF